MNIGCLSCVSICTVALVRGGGAVAHFQCRESEAHRAYLVHGEKMECHKQQVPRSDSDREGVKPDG